MKNMDYSKLSPEQKKQAEQLKNTAKKYQGKSQSELFAELERIKRSDSGNITPAKLAKFKKQVSPMLNTQQKKRLDDIIKKLEKP